MTGSIRSPALGSGSAMDSRCLTQKINKQHEPEPQNYHQPVPKASAELIADRGDKGQVATLTQVKLHIGRHGSGTADVLSHGVSERGTDQAKGLDTKHAL